MLKVSESELRAIERRLGQDSTRNAMEAEKSALNQFEGQIDSDAKPRKFKNRKCSADGFTFDSLSERSRYLELKVLERAGEISSLRLQPRYRLQDAFTDCSGRRHRAIDYVGDFEYVEDGQVISEDVKSKDKRTGDKPTETAAFSVKWKLAIKRYPLIEFRKVYR